MADDTDGDAADRATGDATSAIATKTAPAPPFLDRPGMAWHMANHIRVAPGKRQRRTKVKTGTDKTTTTERKGFDIRKYLSLMPPSQPSQRSDETGNPAADDNSDDRRSAASGDLDVPAAKRPALETSRGVDGDATGTDSQSPPRL